MKLQRNFQRQAIKIAVYGFLIVVVLFDAGSIRAQVKPAGSFAKTQEFVANNNLFALDLYSRLREQKGNVFFSPLSVSRVLTMAFFGARGETASQMVHALRFNYTQEQWNMVLGDIKAEYQAVQKKGYIQFFEANSLWPQAGEPILAKYLLTCETNFSTLVQPVDFINDSEGARTIINDWTELNTNKKIINLIKRKMLNSSTRMVIVNTTYFKANWSLRFDKSRTENAFFFVAKDQMVQTPFMHQTGYFGYAGLDGFQIFEIPYVGSDISMVFILPHSTYGLEKIEGKLTESNLATWSENLKWRGVEVYLPKFRIDSSYLMNNSLKKMGMRDAFDGQRADFSGINGSKKLFISALQHEAFINVDELGTEVTAASAVAMEGTGAPVSKPEPIPVIRIDHPFLFFVRDNKTKSILFIGRVVSPVE